MKGVLTRKTTFLVRCVKRAYTRITMASRCRTELGARVSVIDSGLIQSAEHARIFRLMCGSFIITGEDSEETALFLSRFPSNFQIAVSLRH